MSGACEYSENGNGPHYCDKCWRTGMFADELEWTTEPPKVPGWYWAVEPDQAGDELTLVVIKDVAGHLCARLCDGFNTEAELDYFKAWAGPINPPEVPK